MPRVGLKRHSFDLIRPDDYIALVVADGDPQQLRGYLLVRYGTSSATSSNSPDGN